MLTGNMCLGKQGSILFTKARTLSVRQGNAVPRPGKERHSVNTMLWVGLTDTAKVTWAQVLLVWGTAHSACPRS